LAAFGAESTEKGRADGRFRARDDFVLAVLFRSAAALSPGNRRPVFQKI